MRYLEVSAEDRFDPKVASVIFGENYSFSSMCVVRLEHGTNEPTRVNVVRCWEMSWRRCDKFGNGECEVRQRSVSNGARVQHRRFRTTP
jgi:hypothetical protein